jgi:hypothetical protein
MSLFKRSRPAAPPRWASYFAADEWAAFSGLMSRDAGRRGWVDDVEEGFVMQPFPEVLMALGSIAQKCHGAPRAEWPEMISTHLDRAVAMDEAIDVDPEQSRALLRVRLLPDEFFAPFDRELASRQIADGLHLVLAHDLPTMVSMPSREDVRRLGDEDEMFALAIEQTRAEMDLDPQRYDLRNPNGSSTPVWLVNDESFFTATFAVWGDELLPPTSEHGTLVAAPNRHTLLVHPIRSLDVLGAVNHMLELTRRMYAEGPGSISESVYWLRRGCLERLEHRVDVGQLVFRPSEGFLQVLYGLDRPAR